MELILVSMVAIFALLAAELVDQVAAALSFRAVAAAVPAIAPAPLVTAMTDVHARPAANLDANQGFDRAA